MMSFMLKMKKENHIHIDLLFGDQYNNQIDNKTWIYHIANYGLEHGVMVLII